MGCEYISDKLFQNINYSTFRAKDSHGKIFLGRFNSSYKSVSFKSEFDFKCKLTQWPFNVSSDISCILRSYKKLKVALSFVYNLKHLFLHSFIVSSITRNINFEIVLLVNDWFNPTFI